MAIESTDVGEQKDAPPRQNLSRGSGSGILRNQFALLLGCSFDLFVASSGAALVTSKAMAALACQAHGGSRCH